MTQAAPLTAAFLKLDADDEVIYMTMEDAIGLSLELGTKIKDSGYIPDFVVGLANGAALPTKVVADEVLGAPFQLVKIRRKSSRLKQHLGILKRALSFSPRLLRWKPLNSVNKAFNKRFNQVEQQPLGLDAAGKSVLIIDDCMDSGRSCSEVRRQLLEGGATDVKVGVLAWGAKPWAMMDGQIPPEYYLHRIIHFYPWANNSPHYGEFLSWLKSSGFVLWRA